MPNVEKMINIILQLDENISERMSQSAQALETMEGKIQRMGTHMSQFGRSMTRDITLPIVGVATQMFDSFMEMESVMAELQVRTGATAEEMELLEQKAIEMGRASVFSAADAGQAMLELAASGASANEAIAMGTDVLNLAGAAAMDLGDSADAVTDIMKQFGLQTEDSTYIVDTLARVAGAGSATIEDLIVGLQDAGGVANNFGIELDEANAILQIFSEAGIKGSKAGTTFRSMLSNMSRVTESTSEAWDDLGLSMWDAQGNMRPIDDLFKDINKAMEDMSMEERNRIAQDLAGTYGLLGFNALRAANGTDAMMNAMEGNASAAEVAAARNDTLAGKLQILQGSIETVFYQLGTLAEGPLTDFLDWLIEAVNNVGIWVEENPQLASTLMAVAAALAALGPGLMIVGKFISTFGVLIGILGKLKGAIWAVGGAFKGLGFILPSLGSMLSGLAGMIMGAVKFILSGLTALAGGILKVFMVSLSGLGKVVSVALTGVFKIVAGMLTGIGKFILMIAGGIGQGLMAIVSGIKAGFMALAGLGAPLLALGAAVGGLIIVLDQANKRGTWEIWANNIKMAGVILKEFGSRLVNWVKERTKAFVEMMKSLGKWMIEGLILGLTGGNKELTNTIMKIGEGMINVLKGMLGIGSPSKVMKQIGNDMAEGLRLGVENISNVVAHEAAEFERVLAGMDYDRVFGEMRQRGSSAMNDIAASAQRAAFQVANVGAAFSGIETRAPRRQLETAFGAALHAKWFGASTNAPAARSSRGMGFVGQNLSNRMGGISSAIGNAFSGLSIPGPRRTAVAQSAQPGGVTIQNLNVPPGTTREQAREIMNILAKDIKRKGALGF